MTYKRSLVFPTGKNNTNSIYEKKLLYVQERQSILKKYFNVEESMLDRRQKDFLAVANYCCKAMRYITEIKGSQTKRFLWESLRPDWQEKGVDISYERFSKLIKDVYVVYENYNMHDGLRLMILDCIVSKACNVDDYYRHVVALMKVENEAKLLGILKLMFIYYNDLKRPSYKVAEDV